MNDDPIIKKAYYSIGDVCELTGLKPHVLRYWETQFNALRPSKNSAGNRVYRPKEIELILLVKQLLYDEKYTIEGANQKILDMRSSGDLRDGRRQAVEPEVIAAIKEELESLKELLTLPPEDEQH